MLVLCSGDERTRDPARLGSKRSKTAWPIDFHGAETAATAAARYVPALLLIRPHRLYLALRDVRFPLDDAAGSRGLRSVLSEISRKNTPRYEYPGILHAHQVLIF